MNGYYRKTRRPGRGLGLLEIGLTMALAALLLASISVYRSKVTRQLNLSNDAQHFRIVMAAAESYIELHRSALITPGAAMRTVTLATLRSERILANSVTDQFGSSKQNMEILIRPLAAGVAPASLEALLISYGGRDYDGGELAQLTAMLGGNAGRVNAGVIRGRGGWTSQVNDWSGLVHAPSNGHLVALVSNKVTANASPGIYHWMSRIIEWTQPGWNTMQTALRLAATGTRGWGCQPGQLNGEGSEVLFCAKVRGGGFEWATQTQINSLNLFEQRSFAPATSAYVDYFGTDRNMYITVQGDGSGSSTNEHGCTAGIDVSDSAGRWKSLVINKSFAPAMSKNGSHSCSVSAYISKGVSYRIYINNNWSYSRGRAYISRFFSKYE